MITSALSELERHYLDNKNNPLIKNQLDELITTQINPDNALDCIKFLVDSVFLDAFPDSISQIVPLIPLESLNKYIKEMILSLELVDDNKLLIVMDNYSQLEPETKKYINVSLTQLLTDHMFVLTHCDLNGIYTMPNMKKLIKDYNINFMKQNIFSDGMYIPSSMRVDDDETKERLGLMYELLRHISIDKTNGFEVYHKLVIDKYSQINSYKDSLGEFNRLRESLYPQLEAEKLEKIVESNEVNMAKKFKL